MCELVWGEVDGWDLTPNAQRINRGLQTYQRKATQGGLTMDMKIKGLLVATLLAVPGLVKAEDAAPAAAPATTSAPATAAPATGDKAVATHKHKKTHKKAANGSDMSKTPGK